MLTIFNSFRVPAVPHVDVFRDADDPTAFHLLPDRPSVAVDAASGEKLFSFSLIARDVDIVFASTPESSPREHQVGYLTTTVDLSVSETEMEAIRGHLSALLAQERSQPSNYNKIFKNRTLSTTPTIGYANTWLRGVVRVDLLEGLGGTFKRESSDDISPNLRGTMSTALYATFGSEGAQLIWDALHPRDGETGPEGSLPLQANVRYELEGIARVPELKVTVEADGSKVYKEIRERTRVMERVDGRTFRYPQISELTKSLVEEDVISVVWDDFGIPSGDPDADEIKDQLQRSVLDVVTNQITASFFSEFEFQGIQEDDLGETFTHTLGGKPGSRLWLNEYREEFISSINFTFDYRSNMTFRANPQTSLLSTLSPEEIERHVRFLDVGNPEVQILNVQVETNADFEADNIANVTATLEYDEFDVPTGRRIRKVSDHDNSVFRSPQDRHVFSVRMARDAQGRLLDSYSLTARIHYVGTSESPPEIELRDVRDRALTLSYDRLGYIKVEVSTGDVDWDQIKDVFVDFEYVAASSEPDARATKHLTSENRLATWTASKHGRSDNRYRYRVKYVFEDGREVETDPRTESTGNLVIHDTLVGRLHRAFDAILSPAYVNALNLKVSYANPPEEPEETSHIFTSTGTWEYVRPVTEGASRDLRYRYLVEFQDGHVTSVDWVDLPDGAPLDPIVARRFPLSIFVDGGGLDWNRWRRVVAEITYHDPENDYTKIEELFLVESESFVSMQALTFSPTAREYDYRVTLIPSSAEAGEPVVATGRQAGVLLVETLL